MDPADEVGIKYFVCGGSELQWGEGRGGRDRGKSQSTSMHVSQSQSAAKDDESKKIKNTKRQKYKKSCSCSSGLACTGTWVMREAIHCSSPSERKSEAVFKS